MELHIEDGTVEPSISHAPREAQAARRLKWTDVESRLECFALGRLLLDGMRWGLVVALVTTGYFAAAGINTGLSALRDGGAAGSAQQILAASAAHK